MAVNKKGLEEMASSGYTDDSLYRALQDSESSGDYSYLGDNASDVSNTVVPAVSSAYSNRANGLLSNSTYAADRASGTLYPDEYDYNDWYYNASKNGGSSLDASTFHLSDPDTQNLMYNYASSNAAQALRNQAGYTIDSSDGYNRAYTLNSDGSTDYNDQIATWDMTPGVTYASVDFTADDGSSWTQYLTADQISDAIANNGGVYVNPTTGTEIDVSDWANQIDSSTGDFYSAGYGSSSSGSSSGSSSYYSYPEYQSQYESRIQNMLNTIENARFDYDAETDPDAIALREKYTRQGQDAMENTLAQVSARSGGLASSYATSAATQAYENYMDDLSTQETQLRAQKYSEYQQELSNYYNLLSAYENLENSDYAKYSDSRSYDLELQELGSNLLLSYAQLQYDYDSLNAGLAYDYAALAQDQSQYNTSLAWEQQQYADSLALQNSSLAASNADSIYSTISSLKTDGWSDTDIVSYLQTAGMSDTAINTILSGYNRALSAAAAGTGGYTGSSGSSSGSGAGTTTTGGYTGGYLTGEMQKAANPDLPSRIRSVTKKAVGA